MAMHPNQMICYALYSASHAIQQSYRDLLEPLALTYPQYLVMTVLWSSTERPSVKELGGAIQLDSSTLTPLLKRLQNAGLIDRKRDPKDERQVLIELTQTGRDLQHLATEIPNCVEERVGMSTADIATLRDDLLAMSALLREPAKKRDNQN